MDIKNLTGLSEPATKLIEVVSNAFGTLYEPTRILRQAKAEAHALVIKAFGEIGADDIRQRAAARLLAQETKKQANIESVMHQAATLVSTSPANGRTLDDDWLTRFILEAQEVSDSRLHAVWAKLLSGEFQSPGTYPRRLFRTIKDLEPKEAEIIDSLAPRLLWVDQSGRSTPFLNSHIFEFWHLDNSNRVLLGASPIENVSLLKELGVIDPEDYTFEFSVEGPLYPDKIHIGETSAQRIRAGHLEITPAFIQPAFVRTKGPAVTRDGTPRINQQNRAIIFDAWKVTSIGACLFMLAGKEPDAIHFTEIRNLLLNAGMILQEVK